MRHGPVNPPTAINGPEQGQVARPVHVVGIGARPQQGLGTLQPGDEDGAGTLMFVGCGGGQAHQAAVQLDAPSLGIEHRTGSLSSQQYHSGAGMTLSDPSVHQAAPAASSWPHAHLPRWQATMSEV